MKAAAIKPDPAWVAGLAKGDRVVVRHVDGRGPDIGTVESRHPDNESLLVLTRKGPMRFKRSGWSRHGHRHLAPAAAAPEADHG